MCIETYISIVNIFIISQSRLWKVFSIKYAAKYSGLELLLDCFGSSNVKQKSDASAALHELAAKASYILAPKACSSVYLFDIAPPLQTPQVFNFTLYVLTCHICLFWFVFFIYWTVYSTISN